jgi:two-component system response regulator (stage 0 sporulation protein A)
MVQTVLDEFYPDVLVLDLTLPGIDGLSLMKRIRSMYERPRVLLTTCFMSAYVETAISGLGVDMVMLKPCDAEIIAEQIEDLLYGVQPRLIPAPEHRVSVRSMLMELNVPAKRRGFTYLEKCIRQYLKNPGQSLTKGIYPNVAQVHDTKPEAVERAIRQAVHESWENRNDSIWRMYFNPGREGKIPRPTNAEFISRLAEQYRNVQEKLA